MTPFEIDILLHYATRRGDHPAIHNPPPIWRDTIAKFINEGLLAHNQSGIGSDVTYIATERLLVYAEALQSVPLPVQKWVMPNG